MSGRFLWQGREIAFHTGESVGLALARAGVRALGPRPNGGEHALFCGIGQCQGCLVAVEGRVVEACLTPCHDGARVEPLEAPDAR
jgi:aerobic-type carbon monoxide dehydrogenase small subunit (CoxS/CutS family)